MERNEEGSAVGRQPGWAAHLPPSDRQMDEISAVFAVLRPDDGGDDTVCGFAPSIDFCAVKAGLRGMGFEVKTGELQLQLEHCCPHALQNDRFSLEDFAAVVMRYMARRSTADQLAQDFALLDRDSKGHIDVADLSRIAQTTLPQGAVSDTDLALMLQMLTSASPPRGATSSRPFGTARPRGELRLSLQQYAAAIGVA